MNDTDTEEKTKVKTTSGSETQTNPPETQPGEEHEEQKPVNPPQDVQLSPNGSEKPLQQTSLVQNPTLSTTPVEQNTVEQKPVEQKPVEQKPVEQKPVEQKPVEQKPVEQKPGKQQTEKQQGTPGKSTDGSSSSNDPNESPKPDPAKGKFEKTITTPVKHNAGDKEARNKFLKKEYVDTYDKEKAFDEADKEEKKKILAQMSSPAPEPAKKGILSTIDDGVRSDKMGTALDVVDTINDTAGLGFGISDVAGGSEKASNIGSIATNSVGVATGSVNTYRDIRDTIDAGSNGNSGAVLSGTLKSAGDVLGVGSNVSGIVGSGLELAGKDEKGIAGKTSDIMGAAGNLLSTGSTTVDLFQQRKSMKDINALEKKDPKHKDRKALAKDYTEATKAKRTGSKFSLGAGISDLISSGFSIASDFVSNDTLSSILGLVGSAFGLLGKGIGWLGSYKEKQRQKQNKDSIVDDFVKKETEKVKRHGSVEEEGKLSDVEKENIAIARIGIDISDFSKENQKDALKDKIFNKIGDMRVKAAMGDPEFLKAMGFGSNAKEEAVRDALGYGE